MLLREFPRDAEGVHPTHPQHLLHHAFQPLILTPKHFMGSEGTGLELRALQFLPVLKGKQNTFLRRGLDPRKGVQAEGGRSGQVRGKVSHVCRHQRFGTFDVPALALCPLETLAPLVVLWSCLKDAQCHRLGFSPTDTGSVNPSRNRAGDYTNRGGNGIRGQQEREGTNTWGAGLGQRAGGLKGLGGRRGSNCWDLRVERWGALGWTVVPTWMQEMGGLLGKGVCVYTVQCPSWEALSAVDKTGMMPWRQRRCM